MFSAIVIDKNDAGQTVSLQQLEDSQLPEGDVKIDVAYSTLNYKDALAITGSSPIARIWPLVPGIDLAGTVTESSNPDWKAGDAAIRLSGSPAARATSPIGASSARQRSA